jgi:hypothetical protein
MELIEFEDEELTVTQPVVLSVEGFDFVVGAFQRPGGDGVIVPSEDAVGVGQEGASEVL